LYDNYNCILSTNQTLQNNTVQAFPQSRIKTFKY
jgi:hypothetical protein